MNTILLNPGPVTLSERVRKALLRPDLCHREAEFAELQARIRARLLAVYDLDPAEWAAILLTCSGTGAVEAMLSSLLPAGDTLTVIENGVYGERMSAIAAAHDISCHPVRHDWGAQIDPSSVGAALDRSACPYLAVVHHETTTGRLNRLESIAPRRHPQTPGACLLVDAVSSFGAEAIDFDAWDIAACAATANKCLHGVPGVSFVIARRALLNDRARRTMYLDLPTYCAAQDAGTTPYTQSVQVFYALDEALAEFSEAGGWRQRQAQYRDFSARVRSGYAALGIEPLLEESDSSCVLNSFRLPPGLTYGALHDGLKEQGFVIYAGQGELSRTMFRIAVMGAISAADIDRLVDATGRVLSAG